MFLALPSEANAQQMPASARQPSADGALQFRAMFSALSGAADEAQSKEHAQAIKNTEESSGEDLEQHIDPAIEGEQDDASELVSEPIVPDEPSPKIAGDSRGVADVEDSANQSDLGISEGFSSKEVQPPLKRTEQTFLTAPEPEDVKTGQDPPRLATVPHATDDIAPIALADVAKENRPLQAQVPSAQIQLEGSVGTALGGSKPDQPAIAAAPLTPKSPENGGASAFQTPDAAQRFIVPSLPAMAQIQPMHAGEILLAAEQNAIQPINAVAPQDAKAAVLLGRLSLQEMPTRQSLVSSEQKLFSPQAAQMAALVPQSPVVDSDSPQTAAAALPEFDRSETHVERVERVRDQSTHLMKSETSARLEPLLAPVSNSRKNTPSISTKPSENGPTLVGSFSQPQRPASGEVTASSGGKAIERATAPVDRAPAFQLPSVQPPQLAIHQSAAIIDAATPVVKFTESPLQPAADTALGIARQIATQIPRPNGTGFEVKLAPEELGAVRLKLTSTEQSSVLTISADRPETMDLMRRHIAVLEQDLRALGHETLSVRFAGSGMGMGSGTGHGHTGSQPEEQTQAPPPQAGATPEADPSLSSTSAPDPSQRANDHLDLRL